MLLIFVFILMAIGIGILVSIYSIFFPLIKTLGDVGSFNMAYYGAVSSIERAELALKYRSPGFEGSGGYAGSTGRGPKSDYKTGDFGFINAAEGNGLGWTISSRTMTIPKAGAGNIEYRLAGPGSSGYNALDYHTTEKILLWYDATSDASNYYTGSTNIAYFSGEEISGAIRLPPKAYTKFGDLCTSCDENNDGVKDDMMVDRSLEGVQAGMYFKIIPNQSIFYYSGAHVDTTKDMVIRKSVINGSGAKLLFGNGYTPINNNIPDYSIHYKTGHVVIASNPSNIEQKKFNEIRAQGPEQATGLELNLGLVSLLRNGNDIYPFLEYQLGFDKLVSDRLYNIEGNGRVGDYDVQIRIKKPTAPGSIAGSFTVIF